MAATTTQLTICNRALQILGYQSISSIQQNDKGARALNRAYTPVLIKTLRDNLWSFALTRAILPASSTSPLFGKANYYQLPPDFIRLGPQDDRYNYVYNDWQIEGQQIATDDKPPLRIRYITSNVTESMFDDSFAEAFAINLALNICEELTQSGTKLEAVSKLYEDAINLARKTNAFEDRPVKPPVDQWILKRF